MNKTLMTGWEVVKHMPSDKNIDPKRFNPFIYDVEVDLFRTSFSEEAYEALLADSQEFDSLDEYNSSQTYAIGDQVIYRSSVFEAVMITQGVLPNDSGAWTPVDKFTIQAYQDLWNKHLCRYLAAEIFHRGMKWGYIQFKSIGLVKRSDAKTGASAVDRSEASDMRREVQQHINLKWDNMKIWLLNHWNDEAYVVNGVELLEPFYLSSCSNVQNSRTSRKFFFNV